MNIEIDPHSKTNLIEEPSLKSSGEDDKILLTDVEMFEKSPRIKGARPISAFPASRASRN